MADLRRKYHSLTFYFRITFIKQRCGTRPSVYGTQWRSNSLLSCDWSNGIRMLTITPRQLKSMNECRWSRNSATWWSSVTETRLSGSSPWHVNISNTVTEIQATYTMPCWKLRFMAWGNEEESMKHIYPNINSKQLELWLIGANSNVICQGKPQFQISYG